MRFLAALLYFLVAAAQASVGLTELPGINGDGPVTVFHQNWTELTVIGQKLRSEQRPQTPLRRGFLFY